MPNPIILIFGYNQVCAAETLFQDNFSGLHKEGYNTYMDEEASGTSLDEKRTSINQLLEQANDIPVESPEIWQKNVNLAKKKSIQILIAHRINYIAYDLPLKMLDIIIRQNSDVLKAHPQGLARGLSDLLAGKIPARKGVSEKRNQILDFNFAKHAVNPRKGVFCITGVYDAARMQTYFRTNYPGHDILSYFPYEGAPFEAFEVNARDPLLNSKIFPHGVRLVDMDNDAQQAKSVIVDDLSLYNTMLIKLKSIESSLKQQNIPQDQLKGIQVALHVLKTNFQQLKALNNADVYLCAIDIYLLQCVAEPMDVDYFKANYLPAKLKLDRLPESKSKEELLLLIKDIFTKYRAATQAGVTTSVVSTNNIALFSGTTGNQTDGDKGTNPILTELVPHNGYLLY